ncbi:hypothetical protein H0H92_004170 [Tricholoma furcatifolium]|nr:hypothetical protein H0H92_004170 [Tricholoma furcatifolium]
MQRYLTLLILALATAVSAHFQLQYPPPRGVFVEDEEPTFCDGYDTPATNRTTFPLSGGFFSLNSEHPQWTTGVLVSSAQDPTSFNNFSQVVPYFQTDGEGLFCFPFDFSSFTNSTGFKDGQNVTIQCTNGTSTNTTSSSTSSSTPAATSSSAAERQILSTGIAGLILGALGVGFVL